jgi:hypothetical protein
MASMFSRVSFSWLQRETQQVPRQQVMKTTFVEHAGHGARSMSSTVDLFS